MGLWSRRDSVDEVRTVDEVGRLGVLMSPQTERELTGFLL